MDTQNGIHQVTDLRIRTSDNAFYFRLRILQSRTVPSSTKRDLERVGFVVNKSQGTRASERERGGKTEGGVRMKE